jgi:putative aldouronate transport system substrate-binding protein
MDDLLTELAPGLYASMTPATWEAARVQGSIYGSINQQIFVKPFGPAFHADVVAELGLQEAINSVTSYGDLTPIMVALQEYVESNDQFSHVTGTLFIMHAENFGYDPQDSQTSMLVVASDDPSAQVVIFSETDAFREAAELTREWYLAGYAPTDLLAPDEIDRGWSAGQYAMRGMAGVVKPGGDAENLARWGVPTVSHAIAEPLLTTAGTTATLTGISSTTRQPELAMQYLELINTDPEFYNLLCKGIEGTHWEWEDESRLLIRPAGGAENFSEVGWNPNTDWMFGNVFNSYYSSEAQVGAWPETAELNRGARPSPVLGFTFNRTPVELELASLSAVTAELFEPIVNGLVDPAEAIPAFNQSLRDAGIERVRDEMQAQIEAWLAANA